MVNTLDMSEILRHAETTYEAIVMIARRARQINDDQKALIDREMEIDDANDDFDDEDFTTVKVPEHHLNLPKPPTQALEEFLNAKIIKEYVDEKVG